MSSLANKVEGAIKHGWIDDLQADLEREDYAVGFAVLGAHSLGAPHIRQRLYWVADSRLLGSSRPGKQTAGSEKHCGIGGLANADGSGWGGGRGMGQSPAGYGIPLPQRVAIIDETRP